MCVKRWLSTKRVIDYIHTLGGCGGPRQFLQALYPNQALRHEFFTWVASEIGEDPTVAYAENFGDIPTAQPEKEGVVAVGYVRLSSFSFADDAGLTGAPELEKARLLLGLICAYGFDTSDEVVKVRFPASCPNLVLFVQLSA